MGSVYKVQNIASGHTYALKFLHKQQTKDATWRRFDIEAKTANKLDHPNLIKVHETGLLADGQPFFIMDLVEGESLSEILRKRGRLPLEKAIKIFVQVGFALSYAHSSGVIHRDIKPSNIMIQEPGTDTTLGSIVKVVDFGIAKLTGQDEFNQQTLTMTGEIFGSPLYMSPEQCMGNTVDQRSDLYSLGCVIYEALTGAPPLVGDTALSTMMKHQSENALSLKEASMGIEFPERIEQIVAHLLAKDVNDRYQSAQLVTADLVSFDCGQINIVSDSPAYSRTRLEESNSWNNWLVAFGALSLLLAGIAIGYFIPRPESAKPAQSPQPLSPFPESKKPTKAENRFQILAQTPGYFSTLGPGKGERVFHFPKFAIGKLKFSDAVEKMAVDVKASGPNFAGIEFFPSPDFRDCPALFKKFRDDDIASLDLSVPRTIDAFPEVHSVDNIIPYILGYKKCRSLSLDDAKISPEAFHKLDDMPAFHELWVARTQLTGDALAKAKTLPNLKLLCLESMKNVKPAVRKIEEAGNIERLILRNCQIDIDDVRRIAKCKSLTVLDLQSNPGVTDECIGLLPVSIVDLYVVDCPITAKSIAAFKHLKNLRYLEITLSSWDQSMIRELRAALPYTRISS